MGTEGSTVLEPLRHGLPALDAAALSGAASCALPARFEGVRNAREFTRRTLHRWGIPGQFDDVALVVSELVTNAMRHGVPSSPPSDLDPPVRLHLMRWSARLVCAVRDPSPEAPEIGAAVGAGAGAGATVGPGFGELAGLGELDGYGGFEGGETLGNGLSDLDRLGQYDDLVAAAAESGRGLRLVDSFSDRWGWHPLRGTVPGKVVWAMFRLDSGVR